MKLTKEDIQKYGTEDEKKLLEMKWYERELQKPINRLKKMVYKATLAIDDVANYDNDTGLEGENNRIFWECVEEAKENMNKAYSLLYPNEEE